jgi:hypothetical protein
MQNDRLNTYHDDQGDRRAGRRYPALENTAQVAWPKDGRTRTAAAQLMDVSRDGLLVLVDDAPESGSVVVIRLLQPTVTAWVEVTVKESRRMRQGPYQVRLSFNKTPPAGFLTLAASRRGDVN